MESPSYSYLLCADHDTAVEYASMLQSKGHTCIIASTGDMLLVSTLEEFDAYHATAPVLEIFHGFDIYEP
tara:strand:+ start:736 stop:945 length:210 start_codon:yes stop_codon:yes gene_type:complete